MTDKFKWLVEQKRYAEARNILIDSIKADKSLKTFRSGVKFIEDIPDFWDEHMGTAFVMPETRAEKQALFDENVDFLKINFSHERVSAVEKLAVDLYPASDPNNPNNIRDAAKKNMSQQQVVGASIIGAGGVAIVAGVVTSTTLVTVAGGIAVAVGAGVLLSEKK